MLTRVGDGSFVGAKQMGGSMFVKGSMQDAFQQSRVFACWWPRAYVLSFVHPATGALPRVVAGRYHWGMLHGVLAAGLRGYLIVLIVRRCLTARLVLDDHRCGFLLLLYFLFACHEVTWQLLQYQSFDDANPFPRECPPADYSDNSLDGPENPRLYDDNAAAIRQSVLGQEQEILLGTALSTGVGGQPTMASHGGLRKPLRSGALVPERQGEGAGLSADTADVEEVDMEEVEQGLEESSEGAVAGAPSSHAGELPVVKV
ncbi:unnamed protein product [Symbiodinium necroappetens]|uniref:Uncharacterized protein n=1 Tax=Symbiodinium necroappetens TaxID=1628268 RepID=A0A812WGQ6_9DINO|nr:unnamed protein product [Symbiodinium necroappetens]